MSGALGQSSLRDLRNHTKGGVAAPGDADYDELRSLFNAMIDSHPAAIARCTGPEDVRTALAWAHETGVRRRSARAVTPSRACRRSRTAS